MPYKPMVPCRHPGCPNLVPAGQKYCEEHKALHPEEKRKVKPTFLHELITFLVGSGEFDG